ncbi:MAG: TRAM domain-containing protein, partial [Acidobacteria bacterium]|nr:TRAM domain-containing protein [Acidobacteriota bacterium]
MKQNNQIIDVTIEKIVPNGFGLAFAENLTVFVPLSAKGDRLRVRINQLKGKTAFAEIVEILEPSSDRTEPRCPYFGRCGGCNFQQMTYAAQLEAKVGIVRDCLTRIGRI